MARKNVLAPVELASAQSLGASFILAPTVIDYQDNVSYQINVTTSDAIGTFSLQVSNDYQLSNALNPLPQTGNWVELTLSGVPTLAGASDNIIISLNQLPYHAIRLVYTRTSGTGTAQVLISARPVGS